MKFFQMCSYGLYIRPQETQHEQLGFEVTQYGVSGKKPPNRHGQDMPLRV